MQYVHVFKRLFQYIYRHRSKLVLVVVLGLIAVLFEVAKPLPIKFVIDNVLSDHPLPRFVSHLFGDALLNVNKRQILYYCIGLMVFIALSSFVLTRVVFNLTVSMAQKLVFDLMVDFFAKLQRLSISFHSRNKVGDLL